MLSESLVLSHARLLVDDGPVRRARRRLASGALAVGLLAGLSTPTWARPAPDSFADLAAQVSPAVVNIAVEQSAETAARQPQASPGAPGPGAPAPGARPPGSPFGDNAPLREFMERFFGERLPEALPRQGRPDLRRSAVGSGFIIDADGYVVTNHHVAGEADEISVTLSDGESYDATLIGSDARTDLALLKIEAKQPLPTVAFGDSDGIRPGDWVMAVGNPFGLGGTVTAGIVSARGRDLPGGALIDYLQLDAPINRGNSGGPSFDMNGKVIGVNTAIYSPNGGSVGIGFAIPAKLAAEVIAELRENGRIERGWLGVQVQPVSPDIAEGLGLEEPRGALVASLVEDGPAEAAGLEPGDVILSWDDKPVEALKDLPRLVAATPAKKEVEVEVWRDRKTSSLSVVTGRLQDERQVVAGRSGPTPERAADRAALPGTGITVAELDRETRARFGIPEAAEGVAIIEVEPDSDAQRQGLRPGQVIASIALEAVSTVAEARAAIAALADGDEAGAVATLMVLDGAGQRFVALRLARV